MYLAAWTALEHKGLCDNGMSLEILRSRGGNMRGFKLSYKKYEKLTGIGLTTAVLRTLDARFQASIH